MARANKEPRRAIALGDTALGVVQVVESVSVARGFKANVNGLVVEGSPRYDAWAEAAKPLLVIEKGAQFALGDYIIYGENKFGERAAQVIDPDLGWKEKTISMYRWIAARIARQDRRMDRLGIAHHMLVAPLAPAKQRQWLERAAANGEDEPWTVARLREAMKEGGDPPVTAYWVLVKCESAEDQAQYMERTEREGRTCKARYSRGKRPTEPDGPQPRLEDVA